MGQVECSTTVENRRSKYFCRGKIFDRHLQRQKLNWQNIFSAYKWTKFMLSSGHGGGNKARRKFNRWNVLPAKNSWSTVYCTCKNFCEGENCAVIKKKTEIEAVKLWAHWTISLKKTWTAVIVTVQWMFLPLSRKKVHNRDTFRGNCLITFPFFSTATAFSVVRVPWLCHAHNSFFFQMQLPISPRKHGIHFLVAYDHLIVCNHFSPFHLISRGLIFMDDCSRQHKPLDQWKT